MMSKYNKIMYDILFWFTVLACIISPVNADMKAMFWPSLICTIVIGIMIGESEKKGQQR
jgi:hypothetical protein